MQENGNTDPYRPADAEYRALARRLLDEARHGALGVQEGREGQVHMALIALAPGPDGSAPLSLMSDLSRHKRALRERPRCGLLIGEAPRKGDVLSGPRLSLQIRAHFLSAAQTGALREHYLRFHPKARLYFQLGDFTLVRLEIESALLNAGFGRACLLSREDLAARG